MMMAIRVSSFFPSNGSLVFSLLIDRNLYIMDTRILSVLYDPNIFSQFMACLVTLFSQIPKLLIFALKCLIHLQQSYIFIEVEIKFLCCPKTELFS